MATFLFWNLNRKPLQESIANLTQLYDIDIFIFVEWEIAIITMLNP